jgi:allantoinase
VSDHSPCTPQLKLLERGDFEQAWGGIAGLQFGLPAVWTGASARGIGFCELTRWMCERPARLVGLYGRKGALAPGFDADIVCWDSTACDVVVPERVHHRHKVTPYAGRRLKGVVQATFVRGTLVYERQAFVREAAGEPLLRPS